MSEDQRHPHGMPITVMKFSDTGDVIVNNDEIEKLFSHPELEDRKLVILSLIGAFRGGKSYFLNYCLRFLYSHYSTVNDRKLFDGEFLFEKNQNWMGSADEPLTGFSWRSGVKRDTIGILIWSDVFLHTIDNTGDKIAILVMDTQGLFDKHSSLTDNSRIFVLSNLISSIQVLNLANRIQEDQLQYLQLTTEFALMSLEDKKDSDNKPFQNLLFLVRDWNNADDYKYGIKGGKSYLDEVLKLKPNQKPELQSVRETILTCYEEVACCLLPNPGKGVSRVKNYNGCWSGMDEEFKDELQRLIECLLLPENLIIKQINSVDVNAKEMKQYFQDYLKLFQSDKIPKVSSIYKLTVDNFMNNLIDKCLHDYRFTIFRNEEVINDENIQAIHDKCKERSLEMYESEKKMGSTDHVAKFKTKLEEEIEKHFSEYKENKERNSEKYKEARERYEELMKKDSARKEEVIKNIDRIKTQLEELKRKRKENKFLTEFYDKQKAVFKTRLANEEEKLKNIEKKDQMEKIFSFVILGIAGVSIPFSAFSAAGVIAAGATQLTALSALGLTFDTFNIVTTSASLVRVVKNLFSRKN